MARPFATWRGVKKGVRVPLKKPSARCGETSAQIRERVVAARVRQQERFATRPRITCNARMGSRELKAHCTLDERTMELLKFAMNDMRLNARAYDRILKVGRTIADLAGSFIITAEISPNISTSAASAPL